MVQSELPMPEPRAVESSSVAETEKVASDLVQRHFQASGGVIALEGDLGAGKTQFVRGLVRALGGDAQLVHSPTFVLLHVYPCGDRRVYHLDAYRTHGPEDFESVGFDELLAQTAAGDLVAVEWPSRVGELLPADTVAVRIEHVAVDRRRIHVDR